MKTNSAPNTLSLRCSSGQALSTFFFYLSILFFLIGFNFTDNRAGGWTQQFMPDLGGRQITDITFLDSLTGYATSSISSDTSYILKTVNGGDNWNIIYRINGFIMNSLQFLSLNTGFVGGTNLIKTTDAGNSWNAISSSLFLEDMYFVNHDTAWFVKSNPLTGGVYRTTNGGASWDPQAAFGNNNPSHIYMYNARIGFIDAGGLRKTSDGGANWTPPISGAGNFLDMYFVDSLTGWKCNLDMKKTTDGGLNWVIQTLPSGGNIVLNGMLKFTNINIDTIWGVGGVISASGGSGMVYKTINGGDNWLFQVPDTSFNIFRYFHNKFVNKSIGWAYAPLTGVHTTTGGDDTFYTSIKQISSISPDEFSLYQNFPNPFNPITSINYELKITNYVVLSVFDITGKHIVDLVNQKQNAGSYEVTFDGSNYSSGIYFYSLFADGKLIDTKKMILIK